MKPTLYQAFQQHIWRRHRQVQHQVLTVSDQVLKMTLFHWRHVEYNTTRGNENLQMTTRSEMRKSQNRDTTHVFKTQKNSLQIVSNYRQHVREVITHLVVQTLLILSNLITSYLHLHRILVTWSIACWPMNSPHLLTSRIISLIK